MWLLISSSPWLYLSFMNRPQLQTNWRALPWCDFPGVSVSLSALSLYNVSVYISPENHCINNSQFEEASMLSLQTKMPMAEEIYAGPGVRTQNLDVTTAESFHPSSHLRCQQQPPRRAAPLLAVTSWDLAGHQGAVPAVPNDGDKHLLAQQ